MSKKIPLIFDGGFEPGTHPVCEPAQVNHPDGLLTVKLGEATCRFQMDLHQITTQLRESFNKHYGPQVMQPYDSSAAFRWSERNGADALSAQLAAATLTLATNGMAFWGRPEGSFLIGEKACEMISRSAYKEAQKRAGLNHKFSKKDLLGPRMIARASDNDWVACPRCGIKFNFKSINHWDEEKHLSCGQLIVLE